MKFYSMLAVGLLVSSTALEAGPSVFVRSEPGTSWWVRQMEARILSKAAGTVNVEKLSDYIEETMLYSPYRVCSLEEVQADTFVGLDRETQADIDATRKDASWQVESTTPDGRKVLAQSVLFESCYQDDPRGAALLLVDAASGEILRWEPLGERHRDDGISHPAWVIF